MRLRSAEDLLLAGTHTVPNHPSLFGVPGSLSTRFASIPHRLGQDDPRLSGGEKRVSVPHGIGCHFPIRFHLFWIRPWGVTSELPVIRDL